MLSKMKLTDNLFRVQLSGRMCQTYEFGNTARLKGGHKSKKETDNLNNQINNQPENIDEEMTVTLDLEDGTSVNCAIVTILTVKDQDYIVLLPLEEDGENRDGMVWFYRYYENESDPNEEPVLEYIEDDEEYDIVADAFDEYLDNVEFDELMDEE